MNRSTAAGNFFLTVVSVMTEISDIRERMSSHVCGAPPHEKSPATCGAFVLFERLSIDGYRRVPVPVPV
jgi:hypothetical protein